jgi:hypothetical protein
MAAFTAVLAAGGWTFGDEPSAHLLGVASGTAFAAIAVGQMANAFACRSTTQPVWRLRWWGNPMVLAAVVAEALLLVAFLGVPYLARLLGGTWPSPLGWAGALLTGLGLALADGAAKMRRRRRGQQPGRGHRVAGTDVPEAPGPTTVPQRREPLHARWIGTARHRRTEDVGVTPGARRGRAVDDPRGGS